MVLERLAIEAGICIVLVSVPVAVSLHYRSKAIDAEHEAEKATIRAEAAEENGRTMRSIISSYDAALVRLTNGNREAVDGYAKRAETLDADDGSGWRDAVLPSCVCDAFSDFVCGDASAAGGPAGSVQSSEGGEAGEQR